MSTQRGTQSPSFKYGNGSPASAQDFGFNVEPPSGLYDATHQVPPASYQGDTFNLTGFDGVRYREHLGDHIRAYGQGAYSNGPIASGYQYSPHGVQPSPVYSVPNQDGLNSLAEGQTHPNGPFAGQARSESRHDRGHTPDPPGLNKSSDNLKALSAIDVDNSQTPAFQPADSILGFKYPPATNVGQQALTTEQADKRVIPAPMSIEAQLRFKREKEQEIAQRIRLKPISVQTQLKRQKGKEKEVHDFMQAYHEVNAAKLEAMEAENPLRLHQILGDKLNLNENRGQIQDGAYDLPYGVRLPHHEPEIGRFYIGDKEVDPSRLNTMGLLYPPYRHSPSPNFSIGSARSPEGKTDTISSGRFEHSPNSHSKPKRVAFDLPQDHDLNQSPRGRNPGRRPRNRRKHHQTNMQTRDFELPMPIGDQLRRLGYYPPPSLGILPPAGYQPFPNPEDGARHAAKHSPLKNLPHASRSSVFRAAATPNQPDPHLDPQTPFPSLSSHYPPKEERIPPSVRFAGATLYENVTGGGGAEDRGAAPLLCNLEARMEEMDVLLKREMRARWGVAGEACERLCRLAAEAYAEIFPYELGGMVMDL